MRQVRKAVIPVAGLGTRMLPATKAIPKEMLPIVDKPLIQYVVDECVAAGIKEIVLVTHASKNSIENHFDTSFELESMLERRVKRQLLDEVQSICPDDVTLLHVRQGEALGLGHAIQCAGPAVGDEPFAVVLPDVLIDEAAADASRDNLAAMVRRFDECGHSQVLVEPVAHEQVSNYGVADVAGEKIEAGQASPMGAIVEKPAVDEAPSNLSVVGRYVLSAATWPLLAQTPVGAGDEIQLTDTIAMLMADETVEAFHIQGYSHDCGNKQGYLETFATYALRHESLGAGFEQFLRGRLGVADAGDAEQQVSGAAAGVTEQAEPPH